MANVSQDTKEIYWWPEGGKLIFLGEKATPNFWDQRWQSEDWKKTITRARKGRYFSGILNRYLPDKSSRILEGGCGDGHLVDAMMHWGYKAIGVDFAAATIKKIKEVMPALDVRHGDVRKLDFEDEYFDGYWSLGVIEHFWEGYEAIVSEMNRVLKVGGYAFVTFPGISVLDKLRILVGGYKQFCETVMPELFYQFGLEIQSVKEDFSRMGFECVHTRRSGGLLGIERLWPKWRKVNEKLKALGQKSQAFRIFCTGVSFALAPLCGHSVLLVFRKQEHCKVYRSRQ